MRVLIVGGEGQLGLTLTELSKTAGFASFKATTMESLDLSKEENVKSCFEKEEFDYLVNCAAYTAVDRAESERETAMLINAPAPEWMAKYAHQKGAGIIHISTDYVFGGTGNRPFSPESPKFPTSVYGETKLKGEELVAKENPNHIIIRTAWLYSRYGANFVKTMLRLSEEKSELSVVYDQVGAPTYADDLAAAILRILELSAKDKSSFVPGIYHYSNLGVCSWYDFALMIFKLSKRKVKVSPVLSDEYKTAAERPAYSVMDNSKIRKTLGVQIPYWTNSLEKCIAELNKE